MVFQFASMRPVLACCLAALITACWSVPLQSQSGSKAVQSLKEYQRSEMESQHSEMESRPRETSGFDLDLATTLVHFARVTYCDQAARQSWTCK